MNIRIEGSYEQKDPTGQKGSRIERLCPASDRQRRPGVTKLKLTP
jgi:hypothetical protein